MKLSSSEKLAIKMVRASERHDLGSGADRDFAQLRHKAQGAGMPIPALDSPYLGSDEARLLGWLAALQRQRPEIDVLLDDQWRDCLIRCAVRLECAGACLAYRNVSRGAGTHDRVRQIDPSKESTDAIMRGKAVRPDSGTLQARTLQYVSSRGMVSSRELNRFGASRQVISIMFKRGLLRRVRFGIYSATSDVVAKSVAVQ